jgi:hypothetical protein
MGLLFLGCLLSCGVMVLILLFVVIGVVFFAGSILSGAFGPAGADHTEDAENE